MYPYILATCGGLTVFNFWRYNALLALVTGISWFGMLAYHVANQPDSITQGSNVDSFIIVVYVGMALVSWIMIWQSSPNLGFIFGSKEDKTPDAKGFMEMDNDEYRAALRKRVRSRRRR